MPRALSRLALDRGGPRDLAALARRACDAAARDRRRCSATRQLPDELAAALGAICGAAAASSPTMLAAALADDLPL